MSSLKQTQFLTVSEEELIVVCWWRIQLSWRIIHFTMLS